jgi:hypothetical protein
VLEGRNDALFYFRRQRRGSWILSITHS